MKRLLILWTIGLACAVAYAAYDAVQLYATGIGTGAATVTDTSLPVRGLVKALNVDLYTADGGASTVVVRVTTTAGKGASISGAKTLLDWTTVTAGTELSTNLAASHYLYGDTLVLTCTGSQAGATAQVKVQAILDN